MTKNELIQAIAARSSRHREAGISKVVVAAVLDTLADVAHDELKTEHGDLPLPGLGKLKAVTRAARTGRNPVTGETIELPARHGAKFQAGKELKEALA